MIYRCMVVDDEPPARRILEKYLSNFSNLELVASCSNAFEAMEVMQLATIDILYLDINMPKLSGINFIKSLQQPPLVIFTTAYSEYAIEGFELEATDYLLKPFSIERFTKATFKAISILDNQKKLQHLPQEQHHTILIKADKKLFKVNQDDIYYLEAYGDYVKVHLNDSYLLPKNKLSEYNKSLNKDIFIQIHRSFIINLNQVDYIEGNRVKVGDNFLPISQSFKNELLERMQE